MNDKKAKPHDEAFKKLLQTFFAEFIELFFPELSSSLDHRHTRLLMQELLVDVVGEEAKTLDLLLETRYKALDAYILLCIWSHSRIIKRTSANGCSSTSAVCSRGIARSIG